MMELRHRVTYWERPSIPSVYDLFVDGRAVGEVQVRHKPSHGIHLPEGSGTHVGYEILPDERRKGYGTEILRLALDEARKIGLKEILIGADYDNAASIKIILRNGGELQRVFLRLDNGEPSLHYRIIL